MGVVVGKAAHALNEEADDAHENGRNEQKEEELGQILLDKGERVPVPATKDVSKVQIILREGVWKDHYYYVSVPGQVDVISISRFRFWMGPLVQGGTRMTTLRASRPLIGACVLALATPLAMAQYGQRQSTDSGLPNASSSRPPATQPTAPTQDLPPMMGDPTVQADARLQHDQARLRNVDRQRQIVSDTQKLVELANQLNAAVQKSNKDTLSMDVVRKADEIEKLAKSVREKMKGI